MSDIFICYSRQDFFIADRLMQRLQAEGWSVFIDKQTHVGRRWHKEIEQELQAAGAIVVLWSATSRDSDFVLEEAEYGKRKNCLFPAFIELVEPPYGFSRIQTADLIGWGSSEDHPGLTQLTNALRLHLDRKSPKADDAIKNADPAPPISAPSIGAQSEETKPEQTEINKPWSPMKKLLSVSALVFLGFIIFPIFEWVTGIDGSIDVVESSVDQELPLPSEPANNILSAEPEPIKVTQTNESVFPNDGRRPKTVEIPAGSFTMGEQDEAFIKTLSDDYKKFHGIPEKFIEINQPFYLSETEITYAQYDYYIQAQQKNNLKVKEPKTAEGGRGKQPVVYVSWSEAMAYATWLGDQFNNTSCRLPTEAEWEYAARAGKQTAYPWGDDLGSNNANCDGCDSQWDNMQAAPVKSFSANGFGLHDMSGNVWEWTCSNWGEKFDGSEQQCNGSTTDTKYRVLRGGSWNFDPDNVRSSARDYARPDHRFNFLGFRVLCSSPIE